MDEAKKDLIQAWLRKAQHDLASAGKLAAGPDPILDTAMYHCRQAAEKAVKAFLAFRDHPLERTHNVRVLIESGGVREKFTSSEASPAGVGL